MADSAGGPGVVVDLGVFDWKSCKSDQIKPLSSKFGQFAFLAKLKKVRSLKYGLLTLDLEKIFQPGSTLPNMNI